MGESAEQQARDMLERMEVEGAQSYSGGELAELANLIADVHRMGLRNDETRPIYILALRAQALDEVQALIWSEDQDWPEQVPMPTREQWDRIVTAAFPSPPMAEPNWHCVCSGQDGSVYSAQCPIHDFSVDTTSPHWRKWYDAHNETQRKIKERLGWS